MTKAQRQAQVEAIEKLRGWIKPGDTVYTVLESVSRSGMSRTIRVVLPHVDVPAVVDGVVVCRHTAETCPGRPCAEGCDHVEYAPALPQPPRVSFLHPNHAIGVALGLRQAKRGDGLIVGGCGMDMGFHLVYELSAMLYGGRRCGLHDEGRAPLAGCPFCHGTGYTGGYACLGPGTDHRRRCPSNYHVNHRDQVHCPNHCYPETDISAGSKVYTGVRLIDNGDELPYPCTTCTRGYMPNPEGPERWDLLHTDGYALRHEWL